MARNVSCYPGDELVPTPTEQTHRSVVIQATPESIWPWLVQMGYHRGGWYIDARWDEAIQRHFWPRLVPKEARATFKPPLSVIDPRLQQLAAGDIVPDGPPGSAFFVVKTLDAPHVLALLSHTHLRYLTPKRFWGRRWATHGPFSWAFIIQRLDADHSRLTLRMRARPEPYVLSVLARPWLHLADRIHVRQMLEGIKRRAEAFERTGADPAARGEDHATAPTKARTR